MVCVGCNVAYGAGRFNFSVRLLKSMSGFLVLNIGLGNAWLAGTFSSESCKDICSEIGRMVLQVFSGDA